MSTTTIRPIRIGIVGHDEVVTTKRSGFTLWPSGYSAAVTNAGGELVPLTTPKSGASWAEVLDGIDGVVFSGQVNKTGQPVPSETKLCEYCRKHTIPLLGIDNGMQALNAAFGGTLYADVCRELPQALQHRHPPEKGLRHAIMVERGTRLSELYGEGEVVVNSEHAHVVSKLARGFLVSARALDTVVEAIETEEDDWFCLGVQWRPASATASGLDIQLFRGLVDACKERVVGETPATCTSAA